jgi:hypothetical protein
MLSLRCDKGCSGSLEPAVSRMLSARTPSPGEANVSANIVTETVALKPHLEFLECRQLVRIRRRLDLLVNQALKFQARAPGCFPCVATASMTINAALTSAPAS